MTNKKIFLIEPPVNSTIHSMFMILNEQLNKCSLFNNVYILTEFKENDNIRHKKKVLKLISDDDIIFAFTFFTLCTINLDVPKCNVVFINTESIFVKSWYKKFLIFYNKVNIKCICDYSYKNIEKYKNILPNISYVIYCPMYHNSFTKSIFNNNNNKNIDILFYGNMNSLRRINIQKQLTNHLPHRNILFTCDFPNTIKNIINSKIVIVIHFYEEDLPIDYYRIYQLICNNVFVIHEDVQIEDKSCTQYKLLSESFVFCDYDKFPDMCEKYLNYTQLERDLICQKTLNTFKTYFNMNDKFNELIINNSFIQKNDKL